MLSMPALWAGDQCSIHINDKNAKITRYKNHNEGNFGENKSPKLCKKLERPHLPFASQHDRLATCGTRVHTPPSAPPHHRHPLESATSTQQIPASRMHFPPSGRTAARFRTLRQPRVSTVVVVAAMVAAGPAPAHAGGGRGSRTPDGDHAKMVSSRRFLVRMVPGLCWASGWLASSGGHCDTGLPSMACLRS